MTSLNSKLQLAMLNRKKGRNLVEKGFTLCGADDRDCDCWHSQLSRHSQASLTSVAKQRQQKQPKKLASS